MDWGCRRTFRQIFSGTLFGFSLVLLVSIFVFTGIGFQLLVAIPTQLGLIEILSPEDIIPLQLPHTEQITFTETGKYGIYTQERFIEARAIAIQDVNQTNLILEQQENRTIYNTELLQGTLIYTFTVSETGQYTVSSPTGANATLLIAPIYGATNTRTLLLFYLTPIIAIALIWWGILRFRDRGRRAKAKEKAQKWDDWTQG